METPSNNVDKVNENTLSHPNYNENGQISQVNGQNSNNLTPEANEKLKQIDSADSSALGRTVFKQKAKAKQLEVREALADATQAGDEAKVAKLSEQDGALSKVISSVDNDQPVKASLAKAAGVQTNHTSSPDGKHFNETVSFDSIGETEKVAQKAKVTRDPGSHSAPVSDAPKSDMPKSGTPDEPGAVRSFMDAHSGSGSNETQMKSGAAETAHASTNMESAPHSAPKSKVGRILTWAATATGVGALFSSTADASVMKPSTVAPEVNMPASHELSGADQAGFAMQGAFNGLNAVQAGVEMKQGASAKVGDLAKGSSYADGIKSVAKDAVDVSDFKGVAKSFADDGAIMGAKMTGKALGKSAMKKLPGVGVAAGAYFAAERAEAGDYIGAAMEFASGAVSLVPGIGTAASVAIDGALMKRDYDAATQSQPQEGTVQSGSAGSVSAVGKGSNGGTASSVAPQILSSQEQSSLTPTEKINTLNERVQSMSNEEAGESYISTVAPQGSTSKIIKEAKAGTLTREKLVEHGVSEDIAQTVPVGDSGTTSTAQMGEMYKEGTAQIAGVMAASENPSIKYGKGLGNSVSSGNISSVTASSMAESFDSGNIEVPVQASSTQQVVPTPRVVQQAPVAQAVPSTHINSGDNMSALHPVNNSDVPAPIQGTPVANSTQSAISSLAAAAANNVQPAAEQTSTISEVASMANTTHAPQQTSIIRERVVESASKSVDPLTDMGASGSGNEVQEFARSATSPGNIQTSNSDIKKSIDDVSAAMEGAKTQASPEQIDLNSLALGDLVNGMAMSAPVQTTAGELTIGNKDGFMTLGQGQGAIQTPVSSEFMQTAPADTVDKFAATLSNSKLTNESVSALKDETEYGTVGIASTSEMMYEMSTDNKKTSLDARISGGDQVSLLEDLVDNMEKMQVSLAPVEEKKVV